MRKSRGIEEETNEETSVKERTKTRGKGGNSGNGAWDRKEAAWRGSRARHTNSARWRGSDSGTKRARCGEWIKAGEAADRSPRLLASGA